MGNIKPKIALVSVSVCLLTISAAFIAYYGQIFEPSPLLNMNMKFLTQDPVKNITKPYLWEIDIIKGDADKVSIFESEVEGRSALGLSVHRSNQNSSSVWTTLHVRQDVRGQALDAIFRSKISLWVFPTFPYWYSLDSGNPENTFGIEINDGTNLLWYVFADAPSRVFQLPRHRILLVQTPLNSWSFREIEITKEFQEAGWKKPESVSFILILGTTWIHPGTWVGYFSGMSVDVSPLQTAKLSSTQIAALVLGDALVILALIALSGILQRPKTRRLPHASRRDIKSRGGG